MAEHNLIQAPELIRRLSRRLGLRQAHITPTLGEVVTPVVIMDDIRASKDARPKVFTGASDLAGDGISKGPAFALWNPEHSGVTVRIRKIKFTATGPATQNVYYLTWVFFP